MQVITPNTGKTLFSRLKGLFRSGINYREYESLINSTERTVVGNLPEDILSKLISGNAAGKKDAILSVQNAFEEASKVLSGHEQIYVKAINSIPETYGSFYKLSRGHLNDIQGFLSGDNATSLFIQAEEALLKGLKKYIPEVDNVIIKSVGNGSFATGYKVEVLNKQKQKMFTDKFIKLFYKGAPAIEYTNKTESIVQKLSDREILKACKGLPQYKDCTANEIRNLFSGDIVLGDFFKRSHGAIAEANANEYLKTLLKSKKKKGIEQGIVLADMYNLGETKFMVSEFVDGTKQAKKRFDFTRLGLFYDDWLNSDNLINGVRTDIGGVVPLADKELTKVTQSALVGDKEGYKLFRKILNTKKSLRKETINNLYDEAIFNTKDRIKQAHQLSALNEISRIYKELP